MYLLISADGKIYSFGAGGDGQLGHGDTEVGLFITMNNVSFLMKLRNLHNFLKGPD